MSTSWNNKCVKRNVADAKVSGVLTKLQKRIARDEVRFKNLRCVYMYCDLLNNTYMDNVLMLDYSTRDVHDKFLKMNISCVVSDIIKKHSKERVKEDPSLFPFHLIDIHYVGVFDKVKLQFTRNKSVKKIIDCDEVLKTVMEIEK